jgi:glycosyltransferase involved in cell wall biosynthesis
MKKTNLAIFNTQPPHLFYGGVERRIFEIAKRISQQVNSTIYSGTKSGFRKPTTINSINFVPCFSTDIIYPLDNWFFNNTISRSSKRIIADIYESHNVSGYKFINRVKQQNLKKSIIQTIHGVLADEYIHAAKRTEASIQTKLANLIMWKFAQLEKQAAKNADLVITISKYTKKKIIQLYDINKEKIKIIPNGVDIQKFKPRETQKKIKDKTGLINRPKILFVGRLIPRKGLSFLIKAAQKIVKEQKNAIFIIVGEGPQKKHIVRNLKKKKLFKNFIFLGDVNEDRLPQIYNIADIFVFPSIQEGQGIALLEAQATSKPVVSFKTSGIKETVMDKKTGLLTEINSYDFARAILKLIENEQLQEKMGKNGREFVTKYFSWEKSAKEILKIYKEISSKK